MENEGIKNHINDKKCYELNLPELPKKKKKKDNPWASAFLLALQAVSQQAPSCPWSHSVLGRAWTSATTCILVTQSLSV